MRKVVVEIAEDTTRPEGGHAVILLRGVTVFPDHATFRLKSVEARGHEEAGFNEWPHGDLVPLKIRQGDAGIELVIGPDIVDSPALVPGTLGVIEIKRAGLRGEFLWPSLRPTARPRRRNIALVKRPAPTRPTDMAMDVRPATGPAANATSARAGITAAIPVAAVSSAPGTGSQHLITALDHATPAAATVAEAIGGNVVLFNPAREAQSGGDRADRHAKQSTDREELPSSKPDRASQDAPPAVPRALVERRPRHWHRLLALAGLVSILVSSGYLAVHLRSTGLATATGGDTSQVTPPPAEPPVQSAPQTTRNADAGDRSSPTGETGIAETGETQSAQLATPQPEIPQDPAEPARERSTVTLRMRGGGFSISGVLKGFDGSKYLIETASAGTLTMDASRFECEGDDCRRAPAAILPLDERPSPSKPDKLRIEGADALAAAYIPQLIGDFARSIDAVVRKLASDEPRLQRFRLADARGSELATIDVVSNSSVAALSALERGAAQVALLDRPDAAVVQIRTLPQPQRGRQPAVPAPTAQPGEIAIATDGVALVTGAGIAPAAISLDRLARVMAGQITDWFDLGMRPGPIALYAPPDSSGTAEAFARQIMRPRGLEISRSAVRLAGDAQVAEAAARDTRSIAIVSFAAMGNTRPIGLETQCGLVLRPTAFNVKAGEYPLVRRLSLQVPAQVQLPSARGLVRIAQSSETQAAVATARLIDTSVAVLSLEEQAERMAWAANAPAGSFDAAELRRMLTDLDGSVRLSLTFRYVSGTDELDARSRRDVLRLAAALKEPELAGRSVILAGYTDASGRLAANMAAATRRAGQLRTALLGAAGGDLDPRLVVAKGYGPLAPVACAGQADSSRLNRRVEVWVSAKPVR